MIFLRKIIKALVLFLAGGTAYGIIELLWRGYTHWSMLLTGGVCFLIMYNVYTKHTQINIFRRFAYGSLIITAVEFTLGLILNYHLKMHIWDYSNLHFNILGQISLLYSILWGLLSIPVSYLCVKIDKLITRSSTV